MGLEQDNLLPSPWQRGVLAVQGGPKTVIVKATGHSFAKTKTPQFSRLNIPVNGFNPAPAESV